MEMAKVGGRVTTESSRVRIRVDSTGKGLKIEGEGEGGGTRNKKVISKGVTCKL